MIRKIIKIGNSEGITIPVSAIKAHKLKVGDKIEVLLNPPGETARLLEEAIGPLPSPGIERTHYVRKRMIELVESNINAAVFEVSVPSLGTGIEIAHAYTRPTRSLSEISILALYQEDYWPGGLSSMVLGISEEEYPNFQLKNYSNPEEARSHIVQFLQNLRSAT